MLTPDKIADWMAAHSPHRLASFVMPYLVALLTVVAILTAGTAMTAKHLAEENQRIAEIAAVSAHRLERGLLDGCEHNGNTIRKLLQNRIRAELSSPEKLKQFEELFPHISKSKLAALAKKDDEKKRAEIRRLRPVNCHILYQTRVH